MEQLQAVETTGKNLGILPGIAIQSDSSLVSERFLHLSKELIDQRYYLVRLNMGPNQYCIPCQLMKSGNDLFYFYNEIEDEIYNLADTKDYFLLPNNL